MKKEGNDLVLAVQDNGKGIADKDLCQRHSFGLLGMRERAALEGGELQITGRPGKGTRVVVRLPL
jgi:signal transduction histidine kinase